MRGILDKMDDDVTITKKTADGASVTIKSPKGTQTDLSGILGGIVQGPDMGPVADNVTAHLTPGEFVMNRPGKQIMDREMPGLLNHYNERGRMELAAGGHIPGYAGGGSVRHRGHDEIVRLRRILETLEPGTRDYQMVLDLILNNPRGYAEGGGVDHSPQVQELIRRARDGDEHAQRILEENGIEWKPTGLVDPNPKQGTTGLQTTNAPATTQGIQDHASEAQHGVAGVQETGTEIQALGQVWQKNVTVPSGADKYKDSPYYDLVSDDRWTNTRSYRLNTEKLLADHRVSQLRGATQGGAAQGEREAWAKQQQAIHDHKERVELESIYGGLDWHDYTGAEGLDQNRREEEARLAAAQAAGGRVREQVEGEARDAARQAVLGTAQAEKQSRFRYLKGETYDVRTKEEAARFVADRIVGKGAIFRLPNGVTGVAS